MKQWYTLCTKPNAEYQVTTALQRREIETYLPELEVVQAKQRREKKPFFPGYLFVKLDFETMGISAVQWTPGLRNIVAFGGQPVPLPNEVIDLIRCRLGEIEAAGGWPAHSFKPGDTVRITAGPFRDMLAIFDGPSTPAKRVQILLAVLGQANRMQIDVDNLEKASPCPKAPPAKRARRTRGRGRHIR
jgi:transcriptional antiterminator RfaH